MIKQKHINHIFCTFVVALLCMTSISASAASIDVETRVVLQTELRSYIDSKTSDGTYTYFDENDGEIRDFRIKAIHPVIFAKGDRYMMCADFIDRMGKKIVIDYVMFPTTNGFVVEKEIEGQRSRLTKIFEKLM